MDENDMPKKRKKEPIKEIPYHTSPEGIMANILFRQIWNTTFILMGMKDLIRIVDPSRMNNNIDEYYEKSRDINLPKQTRAYYKNKMRDIFSNAYGLITNMSKEDEKFYNLKKEDINKILYEKEKHYFKNDN